ncbi:DUF4214 domain-containing protein, partial [Undibacterium sp. Di27W]|uniref:DUF4214 domain-containing protein n=1 Tax=Undibacterium sp. Di27W TaxID=3413036 RepID=UPI003BF1C3A4
AAIAVDNSLANQQKLNWALNDLREKKSAEATAKQVKDSRDLDYNNSVGNIGQMQFMVNLKKRDWDEIADNLQRAKDNLVLRQNQYNAASDASKVALQAKTDAEKEVQAANAASNSSDSGYIRQIYQYFAIILGRFPAQNEINYWINDLRRGDSPQVFAYNIYKGSDSYTRSLSPSALFTRSYHNALGRYDGEIYAGIDYWAGDMSRATDTPNSLGMLFFNFFTGVMNATGSNGQAGKDFLNFNINKVMNAAFQPALDKLKAASDHYDDVKGYEKGANQNLLDAQATLSRAPDSIQAKNDYDQAVRNLDDAVRTSTNAYSAASTAADEYRKAVGAAQSAQDLVSALASAGTPPSGAATSDINAKLSTYNIAQGIATDAQKRADDAYDDLTVIRAASDIRLKELTQLYVLLFNRVDPQSDGLAYWIKQMNGGMSLDAVATSMYHDTRVSPPLDSKTPVQLFEMIYNVNLHHADNDTAGINYWASQLSSASTSGTAKGQIFLALIYSVQFDATTSSAALDARRLFMSAVQQGVDRAASNAVAEYKNKTNIAGGYALDAANKYKTYSDAVIASGGTVSPLSPSASTKADNIAKLLQVMFLMRNSTSMVFSDWAKLSSLIDSIASGQDSLPSAAGKLYTYLGGDGQSSDALINQIYRGALARTDYDGYQSTWAANLNTGRQANNDTVKGNVFLDILQGVLGAVPGNATAFASRKYFDQNITGLMNKFAEFQNIDLSWKADNAGKQAKALKTAQDDLDAATKASGAAHLNTGGVLGMTTAPTVAATAQQKQIAQLYALLFNRAPEASGLDVWSKAAASNNNLALTAQQMLAGAKPADMPPGISDSDFLARLYTNLGNTDAQRAGKHLTDLQTGVKTRGQVVEQILNEVISNQDSDIPGLNRQQMLANKTAVGLTYALTMKGESPEIAATLFTNVTADNATAGINAALSTSPAAYARSQVASLFIMMFGIEADLKGFDYWAQRVPAINAPLADRVMFVQNIISGDTDHTLEPYKLADNSDFIKKIYNNAFGQAPDAAGLVYWLGKLTTQSRAEVITAILYDIQNSASSNSGSPVVQMQFRLNQKTFAEKLSSALNHLAVLEQNKLNSTGSADQSILDGLTSAAAVAAGLAIAADSAALKAMGDIVIAKDIPKAGDTSWVPTLKVDAGAIVTPVAPLGHNSILQTNDRWGNVLNTTDVRNAAWVTNYHYDSDNRLLETTRNDGLKDIKTTDAYNSLGQHIGAIDGNGNLSFNILDASGHVLEEHRADGSVAHHDYNGYGDHTKFIDATNVITAYGYDLLGRVTSQTQSGLAGKIDVYHAGDLHEDAETNSIPDRKESLSRVDGLTTLYQYDELGRRIQTTDAEGGILRTWYDLRGNIIKADNASHTKTSEGGQTTSRFDALNHQINETDAVGGQKNWVYDIATGRLISKTDLGGHKTLYAYNYYNQVGQEYGDGAYKKNIFTIYNQLGQVASISDVVTNTNTVYQYDVAGNRLTESVTRLNAEGKVIDVLQDNHLTYDKLGRLTKVETGRYLLMYSYDSNGNRIKVDSTYVSDTNAKLEDGKVVNTTGGNLINSQVQHKVTYNTYDALNRQLIADGINKSSAVDGQGQEIYDIAISDTQGHQFAYDGEGRRTLDRSYTKKIVVGASNPASGYVDETYRYDIIGRLDTTTRDGMIIDQRRYTANSQLER